MNRALHSLSRTLTATPSPSSRFRQSLSIIQEQAISRRMQRAERMMSAAYRDSFQPGNIHQRLQSWDRTSLLATEKALASRLHRRVFNTRAGADTDQKIVSPAGPV